MAKILILGGGFGGIYAVLELERLLKGRRDVEITLVSRENYLLFTPMLHEVATGDVSVTDVVCPIRSMLKWSKFLQGEVTNIDLVNKRVSVTHCSGAELDELTYDHLLIALGSETNYFGLPGVQEGTCTLKTLEDAIALRNRLIASLEEAEFDSSTGRQKPLLTYIVAGAGFAGVETVASINDFVREAVRFYPSLRHERIRVILVDMIPVALPELGESLGRYAERKLAERNVELRMNTKITGLSENGLEFADSLAERAVVIVWTAGVKPSSVVSTLNCKLDGKRIVANDFLEVPDVEHVWALGDCAKIINPDTGKPYPPTAQHSSRQGKVAAHNIAAAVVGSGDKRLFRYKTIGTMAAIGRHAGVANVFGINISGLAAWTMWRSIYLMKLPSLNRQIRVAFAWMLDLFFAKDYVQFMTLAKPLVQNEDCARPVVTSGEVKSENLKS